MSGAVAAKSSKDKGAAPTKGRSPVVRGVAQAEPQANILAVQHAIGNRALGEILQQKQPNNVAPFTTNLPPFVQTVLGVGGRPLHPQIRAEMESRFNHDFSGVEVHTDAKAADSAQALLSRAYTVGNKVVFGSGRYAPETWEGKRLLAHELAHVVQQTPGARRRGSASDPEGEAAAAGRSAASGCEVSVGSTVARGIQCEPLSPEELKEVKAIQDELAFGIYNNDQKTKLRKRLAELAGKQANATQERAHKAPEEKKTAPPDKTDGGSIPQAIRDFAMAKPASTSPGQKQPRQPAQAHATPVSPKKPRPGQESEWKNLEDFGGSQPSPAEMARKAQEMNEAAARKRRIDEEKRLYGFVISPDLFDPKEPKPNIPPAPRGERTRDLKALDTVVLPANVEGERRTWVINLTADFKRVRGDADARLTYSKQFLSEWTIVRKPADWVANATPPSLAIWTRVLELCDEGEAAISGGNLDRAVELLKIAVRQFTHAQHAWYTYVEKNMGGAEKIKTGAEYTKAAADLALLALAIYASGGGALALRGAAAGSAEATQIVTSASRIATWAPVAQELAETGAKLVSGDKVDWAKLPLDMATALISSKLKLGNKFAGGIFGNILNSPEGQSLTKEALKRGVTNEALKRLVASVVNQSADIFIRNYLEGIYSNLTGTKDVPLSQVVQQSWDQLTDPAGFFTRLIIGSMHGVLGGTPKTPTAPAKTEPAKTAPSKPAQKAAVSAGPAAKPAPPPAASKDTAAAPPAPELAAKPAPPAASKDTAAAPAAKPAPPPAVSKDTAAAPPAPAPAAKPAPPPAASIDTAAAPKLAAKAPVTTATPPARGPTIARFGKDETDMLIDFWKQKGAGTTDPDLQKQYQRKIDVLQRKGRPDWEQSEEEIRHLHTQYGGKGETAYRHGREIEKHVGEADVTKPDFVAPNVLGEVKNFNVLYPPNPESANRLLDKLAEQINSRRTHGPADIKAQTVVLDLRGQKVSAQQLQAIGETLAEKTGLPVENIQIVVW
jgi:hypothetical protein